MNALTHEQLEDVKKRFNERGRIAVTNHELGSLIYEVSDSRYEIRKLQEELTNLLERYNRNLNKFHEIKTIVERGEHYGPVA